jgi:hypothetical protein
MYLSAKNTNQQRVFVCLLSALTLCQSNNFTTTLGLQFPVSTGLHCHRVHTFAATHPNNARLKSYADIKYSLHYLNPMLLAVPSPHHDSCAYHVSGSLLSCLSRKEYKINTRANTNNISLRHVYFTANLSTSRQFHYLTQTNNQTYCRRKYGKCNKRKTICAPKR